MNNFHQESGPAVNYEDFLPEESKYPDQRVPASVIAEIKSAEYFGDLFAISGARSFGGQVLKAGVITFQAGARLIVTDMSYPWVAIVTHELQFVDAESPSYISFAQNWLPSTYEPKKATEKPRKPEKSVPKVDGVAGTPGSRGSDGHQGDHAPDNPIIYLIVGNVADKNSRPIPAAMTLSVLARGTDGGSGGDGTPGQPGGDGGDGGDGRMGTVFEGCVNVARNGGPGGVGGGGGLGGKGGDASDGSTIFIVGPRHAWTALSYASYDITPGQGGVGGFSGPSGSSGSGGARGANPGVCRGGFPGITPPTPPTEAVQAESGADGQVGRIYRSTEDDLSIYF